MTACEAHRSPVRGGPDDLGERVTHPRTTLRVTVTAATVAAMALATGPAIGAREHRPVDDDRPLRGGLGLDP